MIVLSVDSSSSSATVALVSSSSVVSEINITDKKQHSEILMTMIDSILKLSNLSINDIDGYVVSKGPGSFTGLRIGMATIKGLSLGSKKPTISISNLDGLAYNVITHNGIICPIMDALRGNVYTALYKNVSGKLERLTDYMILSIDELINRFKEESDSVLFVGDGTEKHLETLKSALTNAVFSPHHLNYARASTLGLLGINLLEQGICDEKDTAPFYLRKSQAEREYDKKMGLD
ncbi:tRNA (adenosine(37)-N6)-threonylcarbamoyltransferase complex dimerization subunit type 1 TsaB [Clostridium zeae]|uniref:tRNA (Adenosine(37)-N6)-threonylcarbamoyltransferase complex dimerization subunit type 1 TsaB n=1 Tax=Clostridium zeae TaxID=2759022 RepID=A0ABQ1E8V9_9CLOT|nr:tRNA (adenosine(37)-N6)-threonylcarbamoyltransferase complex dimerization subunit type 1 TsaB [Clostridium zeae]GFZ31208.1 tRNA (adenosine(37)-N6)-threonylcarbamoyltransferase complex dimerization subunit type 1 TsaB [Clostridium zeae]